MLNSKRHLVVVVDMHGHYITCIKLKAWGLYIHREKYHGQAKCNFFNPKIWYAIHIVYKKQKASIHDALYIKQQTH